MDRTTTLRRMLIGAAVKWRCISASSWAPSESLFLLYKAFLWPVLTYASPGWFPLLRVTNLIKLKRLHRAASRTISGCLSFSATLLLLSEASLPPLRVTLTHFALTSYKRALRPPNISHCNSRYFCSDFVELLDSGLADKQKSMFSVYITRKLWTSCSSFARANVAKKLLFFFLTIFLRCHLKELFFYFCISQLHQGKAALFKCQTMIQIHCYLKLRRHFDRDKFFGNVLVRNDSTQSP